MKIHIKHEQTGTIEFKGSIPDDLTPKLCNNIERMLNNWHYKFSKDPEVFNNYTTNYETVEEVRYILDYWKCQNSEKPMKSVFDAIRDLQQEINNLKDELRNLKYERI